MKTQELGDAFANQVRSSVCAWMDQKLCDIVLFSSLDAEFTTNERSTNGRAVVAATTLPLLNSTESAQFLFENINTDNAVFIDAEGYSLDFLDVIEQLALISGGHPRSLEYIVDACKAKLKSNTTVSIEDVIKIAANSLCSAYNGVGNGQRLFNVRLLAEQTEIGACLDHEDRQSETFRSLVNRGILIDSFGEIITDYFVPFSPE